MNDSTESLCYQKSRTKLLFFETRNYQCLRGVWEKGKIGQMCLHVRHKHKHKRPTCKPERRKHKHKGRARIKGEHTKREWFPFFCACALRLRRCVTCVNKDNASTSKQRSSHKSAILDLKLWRQNFCSLRLRMSPCVYVNRRCKQLCAYVCTYACVVSVN